MLIFVIVVVVVIDRLLRSRPLAKLVAGPVHPAAAAAANLAALLGQQIRGSVFVGVGHGDVVQKL